MDKKICETCKWYFEWFSVCCNGTSDRCADIVDPKSHCNEWEEKQEYGDMREIVEEQLG